MKTFPGQRGVLAPALEKAEKREEFPFPVCSREPHLHLAWSAKQECRRWLVLNQSFDFGQQPAHLLPGEKTCISPWKKCLIPIQPNLSGAACGETHTGYLKAVVTLLLVGRSGWGDGDGVARAYRAGSYCRGVRMKTAAGSPCWFLSRGSFPNRITGAPLTPPKPPQILWPCWSLWSLWPCL